MENLESVYTITLEFCIKRSTTCIFGIAELVDQGKDYVEVSERPIKLETGYLPDIVFEDECNDQFCSIFSDENQTTQITQDREHTTFEKLHSETEILSSEFEMDSGVPILTSDSR